MKSLKEVLNNDGSKYPQISLKKLLGKDVVDVEGFVTDQFGMFTLQITNVILSDGTKIGFEGEHDCAYLETGEVIAEEQLESLYNEQNAE